MISTSTQCADVGWYSYADPGSQFSFHDANCSTLPSRVHHAGGPSGAWGKPDVCSITCSSLMTSFPFVANSGMYSDTGLLMSTAPSPMRIHIAPATNALVA